MLLIKIIAQLLFLYAILLQSSLSLENANYIGSNQCKQCHIQEFSDWQGSHHDWAMKPATPEFVLGDFSGL
ncbi:Uncharacterised protein [Zhongshania aliphaticivorans]|uniref:Cytochrome c-552/4 domain-containing protein n=1 Tax=Zhongshania aliphaticivorans TaxID=1470434 RepID=A0A5S9QHJ1_9GAMM|nr:Uncharacterised protein [Zhongshania aliphaticivorans]CAA0118162.1 Uncharacterised protein [Zhongshania aliphaticivorans]CAA0122168.1 Uncharacterised protein [Zhongshania aliphaticivorans]